MTPDRNRNTAGWNRRLWALGAAVAVALGSVGSAQTGVGPETVGALGQTSAFFTGQIEKLMVNDVSDPWSGGWMRVGGQNYILPRNLLVDLPANRLSLTDLFLGAPPACVALGQSGLASSDSCLNGLPAAQVTTGNANRMGTGELIVGELFVEKGLEVINGKVTFINYTDGYFRINSQGDSGGTMVRINDPGSRHTIQLGAGCANPVDNCSADPRFTIDDVNYMIKSTTGYPMCIPSTQGISIAPDGIRAVGSNSNGVGDPYCPQSNRGVATSPAGFVVPNSTRYAPIRVGDHVLVEGNIEVVNGVRFLSAWSVQVHEALLTRDDPTQPAYMVWDEVEWDVAGFNNGRLRMLMIGMTTLPDSQVDVYALRVDPTTGEYLEDPIASTVGNPNVTAGIAFAGFGGLFKFQYDVDFLAPTRQAERRPCNVLANAGFTKCAGDSTIEDFRVLSPISREIIGRTRHPLNNGVVTKDINGVDANHDNYLTPLGVGHPEFAEINLNGLSTPFIFEGENWNWDRRLSPGGCVDLNGCEATPKPLDPFPSSGLDPRTQVFSGIGLAGPLPDPDRIFTFFTRAGGNITHPNGIQTPLLTAQLLAGYPGVTTPAPGTIPAAPSWSATPPPAGGGGTPPPANTPPTTPDKAVTAVGGAPVVLTTAALLAGSVDADGNPITLLSVATISDAGGVITDNLNGTFTYTAAIGFSGLDRFSFTISDGAGGTATGSVRVTVPDTTLPTVNVTAPLGGTTVTGRVVVSGSAVDLGGVAGITFFDGATAIAPEVTVAPFSVTWNTAAVANGSHTLTARARDVAGNIGTSAPIVVTVTNSATPPPPAGLVAAFNFNTDTGTTATTALNSAGSGNGAIAGAVLVPSQTGFGTALHFDGINDMVTVTEALAAGPLDAQTAVTLSAWVNPSALAGPSGWRTIVMKERPAGLAYALYANDGDDKASQPAGYMNIAGIDQPVRGVPGLPLNTWTHIAVTYERTQILLYVNGSLRAAVAQAGNITRSNNPLRIGGNAVFTQEFFAGMIDDVRIYNRALSATEIVADKDARIP